MSLAYTRKQEQAIRKAWARLESAVETDHTQESRLRLCLKVQTRSFGPVAARAHVMDAVADGIDYYVDGGAELSAVVRLSDEHVLAFSLGVWLEATGRVSTEVQEALDVSKNTWDGVRKAHLERT